MPEGSRSLRGRGRKPTLKTDDEIDEWRRTSLEEHPEVLLFEGLEEPIVSRLYGSLSFFYKIFLKNAADSPARLSKSSYNRLESGYTSFLTWGGDHGVEEGKLDGILESCQKLKSETIELMASMCRTFIEDLVPLFNVDRPESLKETMEDAIRRIQGGSESPEPHRSGSDLDAAEKLDEAVEDLKNDVDCLMDLTACLEEPVEDIHDDEMPRPPEQDLANPSDAMLPAMQHFRDRIRSKFPRCDPSLVKALSQANYDTMVRLQGERESAALPVTFLAVPGHQVANLKPGDRTDSGIGTSLVRTSNVSAGLQDGGRTSYAPTSYAHTVMTFGESGAARTRIPPQPRHLKVGELFPCTACGKQVPKSSSIPAWKRHLMSDLRPWICCQVSCHCDHRPYSTREEWLRHLKARHDLHHDWDDKQCPFCAEVVPDGGLAMVTHVEHHLQEISLAALGGAAGDGEEEEDDIDDDASNVSGLGVWGAMAPTKPPATASQKSVKVESLQDRPVYVQAAPREDGLWHCPWEGEDYCNHEPSMIRADFDQAVATHLEDFRCKIPGCKRAGHAFATKESLRLHEQDAHGMIPRGHRPYLCSSKGCGRSIPGNGFADAWVRERHIKEVHGNLDLPPLDAGHDAPSSNGSRPGTPGQKRKREGELEGGHSGHGLPAIVVNADGDGDGEGEGGVQ